MGALGRQPSSPCMSLTQPASLHTDAAFGTPPGYSCTADRAEEQRQHQDGLPYIDDSPSSSPHLSSKARGSRDTLESTKAVSLRVGGPGVHGAGARLQACRAPPGGSLKCLCLSGAGSK